MYSSKMRKTWVLTTSLSLFFFFLQTLNQVHASFFCYGDFSTVNYGVNRDYLFSSLPSNVVSNGGFYNASLGRDSSNNRVHVVALCRRGYEKQACQTCLEHVIEDTKSKCPHQKEFFSWVTEEADDVSCSLRYTNRSTFGKLELLPYTLNPNPKNIDSKNMSLFSQEWIAMVNRTLEAASTADTSSVLKYYNATRTEFTEIPDVYALMQCTPDLSSSDCKNCLRECVVEFQRQFWGRQGGGVGRPSCYFRWDLYSFYKAFDNVTKVLAPPRPPPTQASSTTSDCVRDKKGFQGRNIAIIVVPSFINLFIFVGFISSWMRRSSQKRIKENDSNDGQTMLRFDFDMILNATDDFSPENMLGQGGFGSVYKGTLPSGQEIAVKRLARGSGQGDKEFKNEVLLLTRLLHRNLVKLLGFCNEGGERILVFEFVSNLSLDQYLFDEDKRRILTWDVRYKIIEGVARGLLYLHEDSQLKIIHRDLKASNILLDAEMNPKVADFGMARLFNIDQTQGETSKVVGTYGYMAPEYTAHGQFSAKSDVYSFGVMLLEMISGKRNKLEEEEEVEGIQVFVWKKWIEGKSAEIIDPMVEPSNNISKNEVMKLIHIGLLCVQEIVSKRPTINSVLVWLESHDTTSMPIPTPAAFLTEPSSPSPSPSV